MKSMRDAVLLLALILLVASVRVRPVAGAFDLVPETQAATPSVSAPTQPASEGPVVAPTVCVDPAPRPQREADRRVLVHIERDAEGEVRSAISGSGAESVELRACRLG